MIRTTSSGIVTTGTPGSGSYSVWNFYGSCWYAYNSATKNQYDTNHGDLTSTTANPTGYTDCADCGTPDNNNVNVNDNLNNYQATTPERQPKPQRQQHQQPPRLRQLLSDNNNDHRGSLHILVFERLPWDNICDNRCGHQNNINWDHNNRIPQLWNLYNVEFLWDMLVCIQQCN